MAKYNFILVGTGWRSLFYVRIAKALPDVFNLLAVYSRSQETADKFEKEYEVPVTTSIEECKKLSPDFVVVAVKKSEGLETSKKWLNYGFVVLAETPLALNKKGLEELKELDKKKAPLIIAEQYIFFPEYSAILNLLATGIIGEPNYLSISCAHEYHGASLIRYMLNTRTLPDKITTKKFSFPTVETLTRYERISDGRVTGKIRTISLLEFSENKAALYDFDSEQYRSPIRTNSLKIQGVRGEIYNRNVTWLDQDNLPNHAHLNIEKRILETNNPNPNLHTIKEITCISFKGQTLYTPPFGLCGLAEDETAIAQVMLSAGQFATKQIKQPLYPLSEAILDCQMAMDM